MPCFKNTVIESTNLLLFHIELISQAGISCSCAFGRQITKERLDTHLAMPQHCFVAKQLNTTLFCRKTLKYGTFCRETLKYGTFCRKTLKHGTFCRKNTHYEPKNAINCVPSRLRILISPASDHTFRAGLAHNFGG